jgi:hypothetical protein
MTRAPEQTASTEAAGGAEGSVMSEELRREFQELGLSPYEARLLLAMLQVGPATTLELAQASGVPRTSTYPVLRGLSEKQLAYRLPSDGPAVYACLGRDEIFARLDALEQERLRQHRQRSQRVRLMLDEAVPQQPVKSGPPVRLLATTAEQRDTYQRLAEQTHSEALIAASLPNGNGDQLDGVLANLAGRVETRVLYEADQGGGASPAIAAMHACREAGAYARTVDELAVEMAIFDRQAALLTLDRSADTPTVALIEHAGTAEALTDAFKYRWGGGAPCACPNH